MVVELLLVLVGLVVGAGGALLLTRAANRSALAAAEAAHGQRAAESERHHAQRLADLEAATALRSAEAERRLGEERERAERALEQERARHVREIEVLRQDQEARLTELREDSERLKAEFAKLSAEALAKNAESFLTTAEERFKRAHETSAAELAKREKAVAALVEPLSQTLEKVQAELVTSEKERLEAHGQLKEQVAGMQTVASELRTETGQLVKALRTSHIRGRWGEMVLQRVAEASGMSRHITFTTQESFTREGKTQRPDMVVQLPGGKRIVVDAKTPFSGYLDAMEASDEAVRTSRLEAHARHMRSHIKELSEKAYWEAVGTSPEFVVMFIPAEPFLVAALETDPTLMEAAFEANVVLATPATLVALLRTVGYTWRQESLAASAQEILTVGKELHKRIGVFGGHFDDLAKKLNAAVESFNRMSSSVDRRLVPQLERFNELQDIDADAALAPPLEVRATPAAKELLYRFTEEEFDAVLAADGRGAGAALASGADGEVQPESADTADAPAEVAAAAGETALFVAGQESGDPAEPGE